MNNMQQTTIKATLDGKPAGINPNKLYLIDFTKLNSVNDLVLILSAMSIAFPGDHPHIEMLRQFLNTDNPMDIPNRVAPPQSAEFNLPKLKKVK